MWRSLPHGCITILVAGWWFVMVAVTHQRRPDRQSSPTPVINSATINNSVWSPLAEICSEQKIALHSQTLGPSWIVVVAVLQDFRPKSFPSTFFHLKSFNWRGQGLNPEPFPGKVCALPWSNVPSSWYDMQKSLLLRRLTEFNGLSLRCHFSHPVFLSLPENTRYYV